MQIDITKAKSRLTKLMRRAETGEEVVLTRDGRGVVKLVPVQGKPTRTEKMAILERVRKSAAANKKKRRGPSAARSQDFLYDEYGLPK